MKQTTMVVTGEMARSWLKCNTRNRPIRRSHVERLKRDLRAGRWVVTHQGIAFGIDGTLLDGQHRLTAVAETDCPATMIVWQGVPQDAIAGMDQTGVRDGADIMAIINNTPISKEERACINYMVKGITGVHKDSKTVQEQAEWYREHIGAARSACKMMGTKRNGITRAPVVAVIARATHSVDRLVLERFCEVLISGIARTPGEETIILLRDFLMSIGNGVTSSAASSEIYKKTARALVAFRNGEKLLRLYVVSEEQFPLPQSTVAPVVPLRAAV